MKMKRQRKVKRHFFRKAVSLFLSFSLLIIEAPMLAAAPAGAASSATITKIAAAGFYTVILKSDGSVWATGYNGNGGQLGVGEDQVAVGEKTANFYQCKDSNGDFIDDATDIACGGAHTAIIREGGAVWAAGYNSHGELGDGTKVNKPYFVQSLEKAPNEDKAGEAITGATHIACAEFHTVIIRNGGEVWAAGHNEYGKLGDGTNVNRSYFVQSREKDPNEDKAGEAITDATAIAGGSYHTAIIRKGGEVWAAGYNLNSGLGDGTKEN